MSWVAEIVIPLIGALAAVVAAGVKTWSATRSKSEIVINMGDGSKIRIDGSEQAREKVRQVLANSLRSEGESERVDRGQQ